MNRILKIIIIILITKVLHAQQIPMYSHYFYKPMVYNPAYTGTDDVPNVMLLNHTQWVGINGAPQYNVLTFDGHFKNKHAGLGVVLSSDKRGINNRIGGNISYSYKLLLTKKMHILLGVSAGVVNQSINLSNAVIETTNDPSLFTNSQQRTSFDANAGIAYVWDKFEFGFAIPQLANNKLAYNSSMDTRTYYTQARHYMGSLKYNFLLSKEKSISISPLALIRFVPNAPLQYDATINLNWKDKFWIGGTYKSNYAVGAVAGVTLFKCLSIGYSYDFITGSIGKYAGLSHEIMLNFKFKKKKTKTEEEEENAELERLKSQNLNKILIERLLKKIEEVLDKENPTSQEIQALMEEISSFFDDESKDPNQEVLNKYYQSLKKQAQGEFNVLVKGKIFLNDNPTAIDFSNMSVSVTDLSTKQLIATSNPSKDGKYFLILKPAKKYQITVEKAGYKIYTKPFTLSGTAESYEINQEIILEK